MAVRWIDDHRLLGTLLPALRRFAVERIRGLRGGPPGSVVLTRNRITRPLSQARAARRFEGNRVEKEPRPLEIRLAISRSADHETVGVRRRCLACQGR